MGAVLRSVPQRHMAETEFPCGQACTVTMPTRFLLLLERMSLRNFSLATSTIRTWGVRQVMIRGVYK